jgi:hypothetical protein
VRGKHVADGRREGERERERGRGREKRSKKGVDRHTDRQTTAVDSGGKPGTTVPFLIPSFLNVDITQ